MTLVYPATSAALATDSAKAQPRTHVLAIGVGSYPHLKDAAPADRSDKLGNLPDLLGSLTSPPVAAQRFVDWFLEKAGRNPNAPLGSVELLVSAAKAASSATSIERPVMANIRAAFNRWFKRCNENERNVAVFYFCGHGLWKGQTYLLPEDFGSDAANPWSDAIDLEGTVLGMASCKAFGQWYVIDACRQSGVTLEQSIDIRARTLADASSRDLNPRSASVINATAPGNPAFGEEDGMARFTQLLLETLDGAGAARRDGPHGQAWVVDSESVAAAVRKLMEVANRTLSPAERQEVSPGSPYATAPVVLNVLGKTPPPPVPIEIGCEPDEARQAARLMIDGTGGCFEHGPSNDAWSDQVPAGWYTVSAKFEGTTYAAEPLADQMLMPPLYEHTFSV